MKTSFPSQYHLVKKTIRKEDIQKIAQAKSQKLPQKYVLPNWPLKTANTHVLIVENIKKRLKLEKQTRKCYVRIKCQQLKYSKRHNSGNASIIWLPTLDHYLKAEQYLTTNRSTKFYSNIVTNDFQALWRCLTRKKEDSFLINWSSLYLLTGKTRDLNT